MPNPYLCPVCGEPYVQTDKGSVCLNGHGGIRHKCDGLSPKQMERMKKLQKLPTATKLKPIRATEKGVKAIYAIEGQGKLFHCTGSHSRDSGNYVEAVLNGKIFSFYHATEIERELRECLGIEVTRSSTSSTNG